MSYGWGDNRKPGFVRQGPKSLPTGTGSKPEAGRRAAAYTTAGVLNTSARWVGFSPKPMSCYGTAGCRLGNKVGCKQQCRCHQQNRKPLTLRVTATVHCNQRQQSSLPQYVPTSSCSALPRYHCTAVATYAAKLLRSLGGIY